jgi:hypothetical protein
VKVRNGRIKKCNETRATFPKNSRTRDGVLEVWKARRSRVSAAGMFGAKRCGVRATEARGRPERERTDYRASWRATALSFIGRVEVSRMISQDEKREHEVGHGCLTSNEARYRGYLYVKMR